jgi:hypothetical protein
MLNIQQKMKVLGNLNTRELTSLMSELCDRIESLENLLKELQKNDRPKVSKAKSKTNKSS